MTTDEKRESRRLYGQRQRKLKADFVKEYKLSHPCACGQCDPDKLTFHHIDKKTKLLPVSEGVGKGWTLSKLKREIDKCQVMCFACHKSLHQREDPIEKRERQRQRAISKSCTSQKKESLLRSPHIETNHGNLHATSFAGTTSGR
jgi:hypothetical protein